MSQPIGNWRCFFWHKWRWDVYRDTHRDLCVRAGCGIIRCHKMGTKPVEITHATTKGAS